MKTHIIRWALFLSVGLPSQVLVYFLYLFAYAYWRITVFKEVKNKSVPHHSELPTSYGSATHYDGHLLKNSDDHGAFTQYGFLKNIGFSLLLDSDGNFIRARGPEWSSNKKLVSGDVVVAWCFAASIEEKPFDSDIKRAVDNYIKNLGTLSENGDVSNRCNNFGINYCPDSATLKMGQPMAGPQFYTNSALFALAYHLGFKYKVFFWAHWLILGGWYWAFAPVLYSKDKQLFYVRDIVMKSLYVHAQVFGKRWWIIKPMKFINEKISTHKNELFDAMFGIEPKNLPECMHAFFSQREDASSTEIGNGRLSIYIPPAIRQISRQTRLK